MNKFQVGNKVKFVDNTAGNPKYFPPVGTIGTIVATDSDGAFVQWPAGTTSDDDLWYAGSHRLELVTSKMTRAKFEEIVANTITKCLDVSCSDRPYYKCLNNQPIGECLSTVIADELIKAHKEMKGNNK